MLTAQVLSPSFTHVVTQRKNFNQQSPHTTFSPMNKTPILLALSAFVAGCASDSYAPNAPSPWSQDTGPGVQASPLAKAVSYDAQASRPATPPEKKTFSWENNQDTATNRSGMQTALVAPEDPQKIRVVEVNADYGAFSFLRAEKPELNQILTISDNNRKAAARVRVIALGEGNVAVAEFLSRQEGLPTLVVGSEILCFATLAEPAVPVSGDPAAPVDPTLAPVVPQAPATGDVPPDPAM